MNAENGAAQLNENHRRHIRGTFQHIDKLLSEAEHGMIDATSPSPFQEYSDDTTLIQRKVTHDYIVRIREAMRRALEELKIRPPEPKCGAVWAADISLMFSNISLADLTPAKMRAYGQLTDESAQVVDEIRAELGGLLEKLRGYLGQATTGDLQDRLERLAKTSNEVALLRELERIITANALVEFRAPLTTLIDRLETTTFEAAVFGRVSSGKSSLLNYILQTDILPVGVTPVTAIPTRLSYGSAEKVRIEFAERQPTTISLSGLPDYATEELNPGNVKHVTRIFVELPSPRLSEGVTFVDTPGLGSLAVAGAEETVAYLPRCDLGIVLVDASAGLAQDDLMVLHGLYEAGATASVLLSKADLFTVADRQRMLDYITSHVQSQLGIEPAVYAVSVVGNEAQLCDQWFEKDLQPMLKRHRELTALSQKRKVGALREAVVGALQRRLEVSENGDNLRLSEDSIDTVAQALRGADRIVEQAQKNAFHLTGKIPRMRPEILQFMAEQIACAWTESNTADFRRIVADALNGIISDAARQSLEAIEETREELMRRLRTAASASNQELTEELPRPAGLPTFDSTELTHNISLQRPGLLSFFGTTALTPYVRRQLEKQSDHKLTEFLSLYANRLRKWMEQMLIAMHDAFTAASDSYRDQLGPADAPTPNTSEMERDLRILENWNHS
jgi:GTP-binding protein EngB required for normal cell division